MAAHSIDAVKGRGQPVDAGDRVEVGCRQVKREPLPIIKLYHTSSYAKRRRDPSKMSVN